MGIVQDFVSFELDSTVSGVFTVNVGATLEMTNFVAPLDLVDPVGLSFTITSQVSCGTTDLEIRDFIDAKTLVFNETRKYEKLIVTGAEQCDYTIASLDAGEMATIFQFDSNLNSLTYFLEEPTVILTEGMHDYTLVFSIVGSDGQEQQLQVEGQIELISCLPNEDWISVWIADGGLPAHEYHPYVFHVGGYETRIAPKSVSNGRPTQNQVCD